MARRLYLKTMFACSEQQNNLLSLPTAVVVALPRPLFFFTSLKKFGNH
jgi:hypothetical protein